MHVVTSWIFSCVQNTYFTASEVTSLWLDRNMCIIMIIYVCMKKTVHTLLVFKNYTANFLGCITYVSKLHVYIDFSVGKMAHESFELHYQSCVKLLY